jgi:hypothetical protein
MKPPFTMTMFRDKRTVVLLTVAALLLSAPVLARSRKPRPTVTYVSPIECKGDHGKWRWRVKTEKDRPPARIAADHQVTPADIAAWEPPEGKITTRTPRVGREKEWFELTGKVMLVKAEEDGDLHIQLGDPKGKGRMQVIVEIPVDHGHPDSAWSEIRKTVFGWSSQRFPFTTKTGHKLRLDQRPVVRVVGKAFTGRRQPQTAGGIIRSSRFGKSIPMRLAVDEDE